MTLSLLRALAPKTPPVRRRLDGMVVVPCEGPDRDLSVVWDPVEEQIVEVLPTRLVGRYADEDDLWHEARLGWDRPARGWAQAA